jgi:hypothetical protein
MLHLLPIRRLLTAIIALAGTMVLAAVYAGVIGTGDAFNDVKWIIRWSSTSAFVMMLAPYAIWRWTPSLQHLTFPYLGGDWVGRLEFQGPNGNGTRQVTITINHSLLNIVLILDTTEATSRTLVAHAERDAGIKRDRLYYVYLNERKEGVRGAGERYRGLAILRVEMGRQAVLSGDYFTELQGRGKLRVRRQRPHPWWAVWK